MKILAIGDPHGKLPKNLDKIIKKRKIEIIIVTGEIPPAPFEVFYPKHMRKKYNPSYGNKIYKKLVKKLCSYGLPVIVLKGNAYVTSEGVKFVKKLFKKYKNLYYKRTGKVRLKGRNFILFDMIWEKWAYKWLSDSFLNRMTKYDRFRIKELNKLLKETDNPILISHIPPYSYLDTVPKVGHVGSKVILKAIKKYKPKYVLCGHIHEGKGRKNIGKTIVYNLGYRGDYILLDIK